MSRKYWVVSPNVTRQPKITSDWKREIIIHQSAMMGWSPDEYGHSQIGPIFAGKTNNSVQNVDVVLIARRYRWKPDVVGFGVIDADCRKKKFTFSDNEVYLRQLKPFISISELPGDIPFDEVLQSTRSLKQLYPDSDQFNASWQVCNWMEEQLDSLELPYGKTIIETEIPQSGIFSYTVKTGRQVSQARKIEAKLIRQYHEWLVGKGRSLSSLKYNSFQCDCWEVERENLIEAKASVSRENIRMAVGQLFDYAYQGKEKCENPHMAILLPEKPDLSNFEWLVPLTISFIWQEGNIFVDNANGRFA